MHQLQQLGLMDKIIRELDDLEKSQTSVLKKLAQIEVDNINLGVDVLSDALPGIHEEVDDAKEKVSALLEQFKEHRDNFAKENQQYLVETPEKE